eukprot:TRINITY_DN78160_c0_g1_i1.p1 TRINITY_DN78160_c0_g1~~TRINITY_DN78160_c0_g1_i1.p1  ORF type:complete len:805 (+),score=107.55 TRINITY_DN78160_c0_g1_i1:118-2532(+)
MVRWGKRYPTADQTCLTSDEATVSANDGELHTTTQLLTSNENAFAPLAVCSPLPDLEEVHREIQALLSKGGAIKLATCSSLLDPCVRSFMKLHSVNLKTILQSRAIYFVDARADGTYVSLASPKGAQSASGRRWCKMAAEDELAENLADLKTLQTTMGESQYQPPSRSTQRNVRRQKQRQKRREELQHEEAIAAQGEVCIVWLRDDLRLHDNPALFAAARSGRAVIPVFIHDEAEVSPWPMRGAALWWKHCSLHAFAKSLRARCNSNLVVRRGPAVQVLRELCAETGACAVYWNRQAEPWYHERESTAEVALASDGVRVQSFKAVVLAEPWERILQPAKQVDTNILTPHTSKGLFPVHLRANVDQARPKGLWEEDLAAAHQDDGHIAENSKPVASLAGQPLRSPGRWPDSLALSALGYGCTSGSGFPSDMEQFSSSRGRPHTSWAADMAKEWQVGEEPALQRLKTFLRDVLEHGKHERPHRFRADEKCTSALSPYIRFGELSPRTCYAEALKCSLHHRKPFVRRLFWRDLAYAELFKWPTLPSVSLRRQYETQHWSGTRSQLRRWRRGQTGFPLVDAGMRQLWKIGWMPNYIRHVTAQFLIEFLDISWKEGFKWYDYTLLDADVAINAHMWQNGGHSGLSQWSFLLHPVHAAKSADPKGFYVRRWVTELAGLPAEYIHSPWEAPVGLRSSLLLTSDHEYTERMVKDLVSSLRSHLSKVFKVRRAHPQLISKHGHDTLQLENGKQVVLWTREDIRRFDEHSRLATARLSRNVSLHPTVAGMQNALLDEEIRRSNSSNTSADWDLL